MPPVAIALGSNLGDRRAHLQWAIARLRDLLGELRVSTIIETDPEGVPDDQPTFLNAVAVGATALEPAALLPALLRLERERGRERRSFRAARTLDLDLILCGDRVVRSPDLEVPHPRFRERLFVLEPLNELEPEWIDPVTGLTIGELAARARREPKGRPDVQGRRS